MYNKGMRHYDLVSHVGSRYQAPKRWIARHAPQGKCTTRTFDSRSHSCGDESDRSTSRLLTRMPHALAWWGLDSPRALRSLRLAAEDLAIVIALATTIAVVADLHAARVVGVKKVLVVILLILPLGEGKEDGTEHTAEHEKE